jgi:hypothetical protein
MKEVEAYTVQFGYSGVFVECVFNRKLRPLLTRFGYRQLHRENYAAPCYFKSTASILAATRYAPRAIAALQRPSVRRFLQTPSVTKFWLSQQKDNTLMLVRRDRLGPVALASRLRLTILDLYHYKVEKDGLHPDHQWYWSDDEAEFVSLLSRLECRLLTEGFHELAISSFAISTSVKTEYGARTNEGVDRGSAEHRMRQLGYVSSSVPRVGALYVKSLR